MVRRLFLGVLLVGLSTILQAAEIRAPTSVPEHSIAVVEVTSPAASAVIKVRRSLFDIVPTFELASTQPNTRRYAFTGPPGKYLIEWIGYNPGIDSAEAVVEIGKVPDPGPIPPGPTPDPTPLPTGLRVLFLVETNDTGYPWWIRTAEVTSFLTASTVKDGSVPGYRVWDDDYTDAQMEKVSENWRALYKKAKADAAGKTPWMLVTDGTKTQSIPLPTTSADVLKALQGFRVSSL